MDATRRILATLTAGAVTVLIAGCSPGPGADAPRPSVSAPTAATPTGTPGTADTPLAPVGEPETLADDLEAPWSVAFTAGGTPLVSERDSGRILELAADGSAREVGTIGGVAHGGEGGLLGLAIDDTDRVYVYSTGPDGNRIQRYALSGDAGSFGLAEPETILDAIPAARTHNGGRLAFGPDGMLYATTGDAGDRPAAQDPDSLAGKILRMTPDGAAPDDNPFDGSLVYSSGHRNPQGIAWADDGTMFASEFGQDTWDELNIIVAGANYGWPDVEGAGGAERGFTDPVHQWSPGDASPSGIAIVGGTVFVTGLRGERLIALPASDPATATEHLVGEYGRLRDAVAAPDGALWLLTNNTDGRGSPREGDDRVLSVTLD